MQNPYLKQRKKSVLYQKHQKQTKQSFKDQCDIKNIIHQYDRTGLVTHLNQNTPQDIDHTQVSDYQDTLNFVTNVKQHFEQLPQDIQKKFNYDLNKLSEFLSDPKNHEEAQKLGFIQSNNNNGEVLEQPIKQASTSSADEPKETKSTNND